jgi:peptidoglycan/LPS O-acetylase OafA/YrhL
LSTISEESRPRGSLDGGHLPALDGVRGLAILVVLLFHFVVPTSPTTLADRTITWLFSYGALGVDLFFVLSGFLITGILYESRNDGDYFKKFFMRRVLRIFPLYYGVLAVVFFVVPVIPALQGTEIAGLREHQAWAWLYGVNVYLAIHDGWALSYIEHFWSLAVEEHFYLFWPFAVRLLAGNSRGLLAFSLSVALASFLARIVASLMGAGHVAITVLTPFQLDALAMGAFLAVYIRKPGGEAAARHAILPLAAAGVAMFLLQFGVRHFGLAGDAALSFRSGAFHLLFAALLLKAIYAQPDSLWSRFFRSGPMVALGKYSYGLYVYHHFFSYYFVTHATDRQLEALVGSHIAALAIQTIAGMTASMAIAWLSFEFFEKQFLKLKRFWPSNRDTKVSRP